MKKSNGNAHSSQLPIRIGYVAPNIGKSQKRTALEDRAQAEHLTTVSGQTLTVAMVADGIGGGDLGERAATMTIEATFDHLKRSPQADVTQLLQEALVQANQAVYDEAMAEHHKREMGSTAVLVAIHAGRLYLANAGDSRAYLVRGGKVTQVSFDHNWGNEMVRHKKLRPDEAARHPRKDEVTRSMGYAENLQVDSGLYLRGNESEEEAQHNQGYQLQAGDRIIICSDGLIKPRPGGRGHFVETAELAETVRGRSATEAAQTLLNLALDRQTNDNVSVIVLAVGGGFEIPRLPSWGKAALGGAGAIGALALIFFAWQLLRPEQRLPRPDVIEGGSAFVLAISGEQGITVNGKTIELGAVLAKNSRLQIKDCSNCYVVLLMSDFSQLVIGPETEIELTELAQVNTPALITLRRGVMLVILKDDSGNDVSGTGVEVAFPQSGKAKAVAVQPGTIMGVRFDTKTFFNVDCFKVLCEVLEGNSSRLSAKESERIQINRQGEKLEQGGYQVEFYQFLAQSDSALLRSLIPAPTSTPTGVLPTETPTQTPSRTFLPPTRTNTPAPTSTDEPPLATETLTLVPIIVRPGATQAPPTSTPIAQPTNVQPTNAPEPTDEQPPEATPVPPSNTPEPSPTNTPVPQPTVPEFPTDIPTLPPLPTEVPTVPPTSYP